MLIRINHKGDMLTLKEIHDLIPEADDKPSITVIRSRYSNGKRGDDLVKPVAKKQKFVKIEFMGRMTTLYEIAKHPSVEVSYRVLRHRYQRGIRGDDLFKPTAHMERSKPKAKRMAGRWQSHECFRFNMKPHMVDNPLLHIASTRP